MSRWVRFAAVAVLGTALVACGANGGDPVAGQQIPAGPADSPQQPAESGSGSGSGSDQGGSGASGQNGSGAGGSGGSEQGGSRGGSGSDDHARTVGLPKSIRITEISPKDFEDSIVAACGSKDGAPGCLTVTYETVTDPDQGCGFHFVSDPPATSADGSGEWLVQRGSRITATIVTCPQAGDTTSPAPEQTMSPTPDGAEMSTSDSPAASP